MGEDTATEMEEVVPSSSFFGINKNLIMLKITLFFLYGATSSLVPYLTIHMQSIGLTMEQVALINLLLSFTTFLAPSLTGYLVDKFGQYKPVVIVAFLSTAALHHSLLLIPHQETPGVVPPGYVVAHPKKSYVEVWWSPCTSRECPEEEELDVVLEMCQDHCLLKDAKKLKQYRNSSIVDPGSEDDLVFHLGKKKNKTAKWNDTAAQFTLDMHPNLGDPIEQFGIDLDSAEDDDNVMEFKKRFKERLLKRFGVNVTELDEKDLRCGGIVLYANVSTRERLQDYSNDCILQKCQFHSGGPAVCPPDFKQIDDTTFWLYFFLRFSGTVMMTAAVTIMDPIAFTMIEKYGGDFGKERLFSSLGMAIFSPLTGCLIDYTSKGLNYTNYSAAFYTFDSLLVIAAISAFIMPLGSKLPADNIFRDLLNIFKTAHLIVFIFFLFILGNLWGFIESFLFFYLRDLGASNFILGITVTVGTVSSLPFLYGVENITKKIGHINIFVVAFFAHAVRLVGYSIIESAWWCFPFEALESLSVHLMWVAAATYCSILAPEGLLATIIGVCGMAHFSIGRGSGSFVGGHIIAKYGIRQGFRLMGLIAVISGISYAILDFVWLRKKDFNEKEDGDPETGETAKLQNGEPKFKDKGTMVSFERLSLVVEYNQIGSRTSLGRVFRARSSSISAMKSAKSSNSKIDLLKSAIEVNHSRNSNPQMKNSNNLLHNSANSSGKIYKDIRSASNSRLPQRSASLATADKDLVKFIPNEKDELSYNESKSEPQDELK